MRSIMKWVPVLALVLASTAAGARERQKADTAAFRKMVELVRGGEYYIEVDAAFPMGNSSIDISTKHGTKRLGGEGYVSLAGNTGELFLQDTVVTGHMPFFGRAYSVQYGEGGGMEFERTRVEEMEVTVVERRRKQYARVEFSARTEGDVVTFRVEVYGNGNCTVHVTSNRRASISYTGRLTAIPEDKRAYLE